MKKVCTKVSARRMGVRLLLAAALSMLLTVGVFAAENIMTYDNWFLESFSDKEVAASISQEQLALLENSITAIDQCVISDGYAVTLENAITDGYIAYFTFRVDAPEGEVLDGSRYQFREVPLDIFGEDVSDGEVHIRSGGWQMLNDADPTDNTVRLLLEVGINNPEGMHTSLTDGMEKTIILHTLLADAGPEKPYEVQAEGEWRFSFYLPDTALTTKEVEMLSSPVRSTARRQKGQLNFDIGVQITSFRLRPLTSTLVCKEPLTGFWDGIILDPIYVYMKDGSKIPARFSYGTYEDGYCVMNLEFDVPIYLADVDYLAFSGGDKAYMTAETP